MNRSMSYICASTLVSSAPVSCHCHVVPGAGIQTAPPALAATRTGAEGVPALPALAAGGALLLAAGAGGVGGMIPLWLAAALAALFAVPLAAAGAPGLTTVPEALRLFTATGRPAMLGELAGRIGGRSPSGAPTSHPRVTRVMNERAI